MLNRKITLGSSRRHDGFSKKKIILLISLALIIFLSIWEMPIHQSDVSKNIELPTPKEVK